MTDALNGTQAPAQSAISTGEPTALSSAPSSGPTGGKYTQPTAFLDGAPVSMSEIEAAAAKAAGKAPDAPGQQTLPFDGSGKPATQTPPQAQQTQATGTQEQPWYVKYGGFQSEDAFKTGFSAAAADYHATKQKLAQAEAWIAQQQQHAQAPVQQVQQQPAQQRDVRFLPLESRVAQHFGMNDNDFLNMVKSENRATQAQALEMINEYQTLSNPRIQSFVDKRIEEGVQKALAPYAQQLGQVGQTTAQIAAEREQQAFLSGAQPLLNAVYKEIPDIQSNPALNEEFCKAIDEKWESVRWCISKGINPFTDIARSIAYKNQAAIAQAQTAAANQRLQQTGAILNTTPRVGVAETQTKPANAYQNAVQQAAKIGAPQEVVDQFWKAMDRHAPF